MSYTVQKLATLAGISVRTLHYYDQLGLLRPAGVKKNGYRYYGATELLKLQQILFFRELDFSLSDIKSIMASPAYDMQAALRNQKKIIEHKKNRLGRLVKTIDKTIKKLNNEINMDDNELYGNFSKEEMDRYTEEARQRWGNTEAFKQSQERVKKMGKEGLNRVLKESGRLTEEIAACLKNGVAPTSDKTQLLIAKHYDGLRAFYEPNIVMYRGLGNMYVEDERFRATYENIAQGLAQYMRDAMIAYCDGQESKK